MEVADVIRAVCAIHDVSTSNQDRLKCTQVIEEFKEGPPELLASAAFQLMSDGSVILRHTGWTLLEDLIRYKWNLISSEFRVELRNRVFQAIETLVAEDTIEPCARCVVAMMEHEWPQNWPELNTQLQQMSSQGFLFCAIVFAVLRRLVENVATLASVTNQRRRKDMNTAICDSVNDFLGIALNILTSSTLDSMGTLAAKNIFGWLTEMCCSIVMVSLEQQLPHIVDVVVRYLSTAERNIYEQAAQCLVAIAMRKREKQDHSAVISAFFRTEIFSAILTTTSLAADGSQSSEQHYRFLKTLCELLTTLGNFLSKSWIEKSAPSNFETFLSAIVAFFNHDSLMLRYEACDVLVGLSVHSFFRDVPVFAQAMRGVFAKIPKAIMKDGYPSQNPPNASTRFSQMDFDDDLEWHNLFIRFRSRIQLLILENMPLHFSHMLTVYEETVLRRVLLDSRSVSDIEWEGMQRYARNLIQVAYDKSFAESEKERLVKMRDSLVHAMESIDDGSILNEMLSLHSPFLVSYADDFEKLSKYFSILRRALLVLTGNKTLNRHVVSLILRAVQVFPDFFKNHVASVVSLYNEVGEVISKMQLAHLMQVLAVLSNSIDDVSVRLELLRMAAGPSIEYILSSAWCFEDVSSFVKFNAFNIPPSGVFGSPTTMNRIELRRALTCVQGVVQQVSSSSELGSMLIPIYPCLFKLTRCLMEMHLDQNKVLFHPTFRKDLTNMMATERQQIYCSVGENIEVVPNRSTVAESDPAGMERQYVHDLHDQAVTIISAAVSKFPNIIFSLPEISELLGHLTACIDVVPEFRLRHWIKKGWKAVILSCPSSHWPLLKGFFGCIANALHARVDKMWAEVSHIDYDSEPTEEELFYEHLTCVISRDYMNFLRCCYLVSEVEDKKAQSMTPLGEWLFVNKVGLSSVIMTAFSSLAFRDSLLALRSVALCKVLSEKLADCYDDEVGVYMLVCAIRSLQLHGADEIVGTPLVGLVFHIYCSLRRFSDSLPQVLMQIPEATAEIVGDFDNKIRAVIAGDEILVEKQKKEMARRLLKGVISVTVGEQHKKPVFLRPLPPIEKRRRTENDEPDDFSDIAALFADGKC